MVVREVIEALQQLDPGLTVVVRGGGSSPVIRVGVQPRVRCEDGRLWHPASVGEPGGKSFQVVIITD